MGVCPVMGLQSIVLSSLPETGAHGRQLLRPAVTALSQRAAQEEAGRLTQGADWWKRKKGKGYAAT